MQLKSCTIESMCRPFQHVALPLSTLQKIFFGSRVCRQRVIFRPRMSETARHREETLAPLRKRQSRTKTIDILFPHNIPWGLVALFGGKAIFPSRQSKMVWPKAIRVDGPGTMSIPQRGDLVIACGNGRGEPAGTPQLPGAGGHNLGPTVNEHEPSWPSAARGSGWR